MIVLNDERFYTIKDVADKLGIHYLTVVKWKNRKIFPSVIICNKPYVEEEVYNNVLSYIKKDY